MKRRADIRSVYLNAKEKGHDSKMIGTKVIVDNIPYKHKDLESLPQGLKLSDSKIVKVIGGLAFATSNAYLSNFFKCDLHYNGRMFDSAERAYQFERCTRLGAPEIAQQVLDARGASKCKQASGYIKSTGEWDAQKRDIMKEIVSEKSSQNEYLLNSLLSTGKKALIEATTYMFWGAAAVIGSKSLKNGTWKGRNELGLILIEVREEIKRERDWMEMRSSSSDDLGADAPPHSQNQESDIIAYNKKNKNRNLQQNVTASEGSLATAGNHAGKGNQAVTIPSSGLSQEHAQLDTSRFAGPVPATFPHSWTALPQSAPQFNTGVPPPSLHTP